jgi:hypothetical protein
MNRLLISAVAFAAVISQASLAQTLTPDQLAQRTIERRAIEAMNWGMSAVNTDLMLQEMLTKTAGKVNQVVYWSRPLCIAGWLPGHIAKTRGHPWAVLQAIGTGQLQVSGAAATPKAIEAAPFAARVVLNDAALARTLPAGSTGDAAIVNPF